MLMRVGNGCDVRIEDSVDRFWTNAHRPLLVMSLDPGTLGMASFDVPLGFLEGLCRDFPKFDLRLLDAALRAKGERKFGVDTIVQIIDVKEEGSTLSVEVGVVVKGGAPNKRQEKVAALNQVVWKHFGATPGERHTKYCSMRQEFVVTNIIESSAWNFTTEFPIP